MAKKRKRPIDARELRLMIHKKRLNRKGQLAGRASSLHVIRVTLNGHVIQACNGRFVSLLDHYHFPFLRFIYDNAPICVNCISVLTAEGISPPLSNTGVNSDGTGEKHDAQ